MTKAVIASPDGPFAGGWPASGTPGSGGVWSALGLSCLAAALLLWPSPPRPLGRSDRASGRSRRAGRSPRVRLGGDTMTACLMVLLAAGAVLLLGSAAGSAAVAVLGGTVTLLLRWGAADRRGRRELVELTAALRMVARELRAGASPDAAVTAALAGRSGSSRRSRSGVGVPVTDRGRVEQVLRDLVMPEAAPEAAGSRPSVGPPDASRRRRGPVDELTVRLVCGWRLATRTGLPLTRLVDAVVAVAEERTTALDARRAEVAGPRLSGWVLAALPIMGLLLGSGMGVDPFAVLLAPSGWGPILLLTGAVLTAAGLLWSARIVRR